LSHPNEALLRDTYAAMARGDGKAIAASISPDAVWHIPGSSPLAGDKRGLDELFAFWRHIAELSGGGMRLEVRDVLANDERACVWVRGSATRGERAFEELGVHVFEIRGGKIAEAWFHYEDQAAYDEFWS